MMVCILILYTASWLPIRSVVVPNVIKYAEKYGFGVIPICFDDKDYSSSFGFGKLAYIRDIFKSNRYDAVWSLDMDTLITNHSIDVNSFLDDEHDLFICQDVNGINAGSFIIKKSIWTHDFLEYLLSKIGVEGIRCEQDAIVSYMKEFPQSDKIKILPHPSINSYRYDLYPEFQEIRNRDQGHWHEGDFMLHLPGVGMGDRLRILKETPIIL